MKIFLNDRELEGAVAETGLRRFTLEGPGLLRLEAPGYRGKSFRTSEVPGLLRDGRFQVKLETEGGGLVYLREVPTGRQPKSAYFSPEGDRLFVPLLGQRGVDVFRLVENADSGSAPPALSFEKRLAVPGSTASGFVEALCDGERRELWVSNMEENRAHIFDLDTLEYKKDKEETAAMAALNRLDVDMLNEVLAIFTRFVKSVEGNSVSYFDRFPMLQQLMADLGSLGANKHSETLVKAASERFSPTADLSIIFTCFLVTPDGQRYYSDVLRPGTFVTGMEASKCCIAWRFPATLPR
ncbi:MAG: hypothetical protein LBF83_05935 [Spirochaetaceae bacterium]|nr:hypothetical protein [Spirochaetaceae bacterium]